MTLSPELQKLIQEQARKYRYDPNKDPAMIELRRKMRKILEDDYKRKYYYENKADNWAILFMIGIGIMLLCFLNNR